MSRSPIVLVLRSALFNVAFFTVTAVLLIAALPTLILPVATARWAARQSARAALALLGWIVGLRWELRGQVELLRGPALIASKHQSAWDTIIFFVICDRPSYVMKRELMFLPVYGWLAWRQGHIPIDRKAGASALRRLRRAAERAIADGRQIVLFPQGTRVPPGERRPYQPGIAGLYDAVKRPVVPVALNSGLFWGRRSFVKQPGTILIEVLPEIPAGLKRAELMKELETRIEAATTRLEAESRPGL